MSVCRCIYGAKIRALHPGTAAADDGATHLLNGAPMQTRRTRSQQSSATQGGSFKLVEPLWGLDAQGPHVQLQKQDVALMTYEQLRKELSSSDREASSAQHRLAACCCYEGALA